jgi:hypothetical protein
VIQRHENSVVVSQGVSQHIAFSWCPEGWWGEGGNMGMGIVQQDDAINTFILFLILICRF